MKCIICGCELPEGSRFCTECGILQKQKKNCPCCKMELPSDARFCIYCGTPQPKFCLYCNAELQENAKFCMYCGTKVREGVFESGNFISKAATLYNLTEKPILLESGTKGTAGTNNTYVLFGDWPQTVKDENVNINELSSIIINGWQCYRGSDGNSYVKQTAAPLYRGAEFTNGTPIVKGKNYYFKLEPIKWRIIDNNYCGGKLLLSEKALTTNCFDVHGNYWNGIKINRKINLKTVFPNNYEYSTIRAYLNSLDGTSYGVENFQEKGFINKAFSVTAIEKIKKINVDNSNPSIVGRGATTSDYWLDDDKNPYKYVCQNTTDRVFLLSEQEITNENYGFEVCDKGGKTSNRIRPPTDYALAMGKNSSENDEYETTGAWWLRSPYYYTSAYARGITAEGRADFHCIVCNEKGLTVPAIVLSDNFLNYEPKQ